MTSRWISPLRYPGGKVRMSEWLAEVFWRASREGSLLDIEVWIEPFGGGAGAALMALDRHDVPEAWIIETNPAIAAFWETIMVDGGELASKVAATVPTLGLFEQSRELVAAALRGEDVDVGELAYAAFILNRCSRSGLVLPNVGPIGGKQQAGRYTIASRFDGAKLAERIRHVTAFGSRFKPRRGDGIAYIEELDGSIGLEDEVLVFADPPYIGVGNRLYSAGMSRDDHQRVAAALNATPAAWIATYDAHPDVLELYADHQVHEYAIPHTANRQTVGTEYLIAPHDVWLPAGNPLGKGDWRRVA